jgi:hypothetical protein
LPTGAQDAILPHKVRSVSLYYVSFNRCFDALSKRSRACHAVRLRDRAEGKPASLAVQARAFEYNASKRLQAFSAWGSL